MQIYSDSHTPKAKIEFNQGNEVAVSFLFVFLNMELFWLRHWIETQEIWVEFPARPQTSSVRLGTSRRFALHAILVPI